MTDDKIYEELTKIHAEISTVRVQHAVLEAITEDYPKLKETVRRHGEKLATIQGEKSGAAGTQDRTTDRSEAQRQLWTAIAQWAAVFVAMGATFWAAFKK